MSHDDGTGPTQDGARRQPEDGPFPDLSLYERPIDDGIAAADRQGSTVDQFGAQRLAIWLPAKPQALDFAEGLVASSTPGPSARRSDPAVHSRTLRRARGPAVGRQAHEYCISRTLTSPRSARTSAAP